MDLADYIKKATDYKSYTSYVENQVTNSSDIHSEYYPINLKRMERLNKTLTVPIEIEEKLNQLKPLQYLVLVEGWCGDCAQILPVLAKMEQVTKNIELKILVADEFPELLDKHMINNARSVPVLIGVDKEYSQTVFIWGSRPFFGNELLKKYKLDKNYTKDQFNIDLQNAYNKDKGITIMNEIIKLHNEIK